MTVQSMFFTFCLSDIFYFDSTEHDLHIFSLLTMQGVFCTLFALIFLLLIVQTMFCTFCLTDFFAFESAEHDLHNICHDIFAIASAEYVLQSFCLYILSIVCAEHGLHTFSLLQVLCTF